MEQLFDIGVVIFTGLVLGSFATALAYRLPRELSMVTRVHSQCPSCAHNLGVPDLVPLFSWVFLRGRCRYCQAPIGLQYPLI
jgi:leader peptidase (prepilin peptidase)/N-methyltransferase